MRQQMMLDGINFGQQGYAEAPWQFVRGKKGRKVRNSPGFIGRREKRRQKGSQCTRTKKSGTDPTQVVVEKNKSSGDTMKNERMLIALLWDVALKCPPPEFCDGETGSISLIIQLMRFKNWKNRKVKSIVVQTHANYLLGKKYEGLARHNGAVQSV